MRKTGVKGFTLVELIIVMALLVILTMMVAAFTRPVERLFNDTKEYSRTEQVSETVTNYICEKLKFATEVYVFRGNVQDSDLVDNSGNKFKSADGWRCLVFDGYSASSAAIGRTFPDGRKYRGQVYDIDTWTGNFTIVSPDTFTSASVDNIVGGQAFWGRDNYSFFIENSTITFGTPANNATGVPCNTSTAKKLGITMYLLKKDPTNYCGSDFKDQVLNYTTKYVELANCEAVIRDVGVTGDETLFEYGWRASGQSNSDSEVTILYKLPA